MSYYLVVKHDFVKTKESNVVSNNDTCLFTDKRNALEALEECAYSAVIAVNGVEHAAKCLYDESFFLDQRKGFFERKYYITKNAKESPDSLTVWRKHAISKTSKGWVYGQSTKEMSVIEKEFSVSVVRVNADLWGTKPTTPSVTYKPEWFTATAVPNGMTEDEYIAREHKELSKDYAEFLHSTSVFKVLKERVTMDEIPTINLPKIRFENPDEFLVCADAVTWVPPVVEVEVVEATIPDAPPAPAVETVEPTV